MSPSSDNKGGAQAPLDPFEETAADIARREADLAKFDSPEQAAKRAARRQEDFDRGVRLGWWDAEGNPFTTDEDEDEEAVEDDLAEGEDQ